MPGYDTTKVKPDEPSGTEQVVCEDCERGVSARIDRDLNGARTTSYRCPNCGPRLKTEIVRVSGGA